MHTWRKAVSASSKSQIYSEFRSSASSYCRSVYCARNSEIFFCWEFDFGKCRHAINDIVHFAVIDKNASKGKPGDAIKWLGIPRQCIRKQSVRKSIVIIVFNLDRSSYHTDQDRKIEKFPPDASFASANQNRRPLRVEKMLCMVCIAEG